MPHLNVPFTVEVRYPTAPDAATSGTLFYLAHLQPGIPEPLAVAIGLLALRFIRIRRTR